MVIKPSELAPLSSKILKKIVDEAAADTEMAVVEGAADAAQDLLAQPFNHIFYIGGHAVGKLVAKAAADHFASITLEMGGKNPTIIDKSADIDDAVMKTAWGRMCNGGQACVCPDYVLVDASIVDEVTDKMKAALEEMYNADGKGAQNADEFGRIVNKRHWGRIKGLLDDALEKGAELVYGGETNEDDCYIAPTILRGVTQDMKISGEEIFGPIMVIMPYQTREEAIAEIRKHPKPLSSYIFAKDRQAIDYFLAHTTSGNTVVNHNVIQSGTNPNLNFGGVNASGVGRIGGFSTFAECSNARSVVEEGPALMD
ncbi:MAG: aldehyde dehydrogenase family protein, partial [Nevskiales bacterium]